MFIKIKIQLSNIISIIVDICRNILVLLLVFTFCVLNGEKFVLGSINGVFSARLAIMTLLTMIV